MIRTDSSGPCPRVPRREGRVEILEAGDLSHAMARAADNGPAEDELRKHAERQGRRKIEAAVAARLTRTTLIDAFLRARAVNGLDAFTLQDLDDLDAIESVAALLEQRRPAPRASS